MTFEQTIPILYELSKKYLGKILITDMNLTGPIGVDINKMHWLDAFELILRTNNLWYEERPDYVKIIIPADAIKKKELPPDAITVDSREVIISAIFFEADGSKLRQYGFNWDFFRAGEAGQYGDPTITANMSAANDKQTLFQATFSPNLEFGDILATFRAYEASQVGEIVANPQVSVRSGVKGRIQVGSDIAYTTKDFSGNTITQFYSTGSIVDVTPLVMVEDSITYIHLLLKIERSSTAGAGEGGMEIKKSEAQTSILMLDGEETILGGLYINEDSKKRDGIPFLKDLPWWFFGLRYLFGYESNNQIKKELLIVIRADLVPTLEERLASSKNVLNQKHMLYRKRLENNQRMNYYKQQLQNK
jgi:type IV pilus assembly protein PilQ